MIRGEIMKGNKGGQRGFTRSREEKRGAKGGRVMGEIREE